MNSCQQRPRHLIATADELTWKFDRPVIFLGEWCRLYDRRHVWQCMNAIVAAPYGLGESSRKIASNEARALEDKLFPILCNIINQHHGTDHDARFWKIVFGHWFRRYVHVMLNRVKTIEQAFLAYEISGITAYADDQYRLATLDSNSAIWAFNDARWNNALSIRIIDLLNSASCHMDVIEGCESSGFRYDTISSPPSLVTTALQWIRQQTSNAQSYLSRDNDAFIINSYFPIKESIKLQLTLGQCPQAWHTPKLKISEKPDGVLREGLAKQLARKSSSNLEDILSVMLFELLPVCYLEGFTNLNKLVKQQSWPKDPKFIFTSNDFDTNEVFKLWTATKVGTGSKYFTGQHGNAYGTDHYLYSTIEEVTAHKFLTWGWTDGLPQHTPAFIFKTAGRKAEQYNPQGGLLLIEKCLGHRMETWDSTSEFSNYFSEQQNFVSKLAITPKLNLIIRMQANYKYYNWNEESRWRDFDPALKIERGNSPIRDLIARSRLVVHSYDSTGILETLSQNIPTLAFWQNGLDHLRGSAKPYYQLLADVGIVHFTHESIAHKVNGMWDEVEYWWREPNVQFARKKFCERYARISENPVREISQIFTDKPYC